MQNNSLTPDEELNILIHGRPSYIIIHKSHKLHPVLVVWYADCYKAKARRQIVPQASTPVRLTVFWHEKIYLIFYC